MPQVLHTAHAGEHGQPLGQWGALQVNAVISMHRQIGYLWVDPVDLSIVVGVKAGRSVLETVYETERIGDDLRRCP